jgi:ATP-dependent Lhr-like helicase
LYELIQQHKSVLIFTNTRETAEIISSRLRSLDKELKQAVHHGSLSKERRIKAEKEFKNEQLKSLVATSSLELGIDIGSIDLVLQYLSPRQVCRLIQRVGRANHHIEKISKGIVLSDGEDLFESAIIASRALRNDLEKTKPIQNATDVLATQIVGLAMEYYDISDDKLYRIIKRAQPYKNLTKTEFLEILKFLEDLHLIWLNPIGTGYKINKRKRAFDYYFSNLSTIPDTQQYRVVSIIQGEPIGNLDAEFVAEHGKPGEKFICSGRAWKIIGIDGQKIIVEPVEDTESAIPAWEGELIPVPFEVAQEVGKLRKFISENLEKDIANKLVKLFNIDLNSAHEMIEIIKKQKASHHVPTPYSWLIENYKDFIIIHSCCGSLVNDTIGRYLAAILTASTGVAVNVKTDPYRIILQTTASVQEIMNALQKADNLEEVLTLSLERSQMFKHRFLQVAKRFGIVEKDADFQTVSITRIIDQYTGTPVYKETLREIFHDKLDIERTKNVLEKIKNKKITLVFQPGLSYLGELGLSYQFGELVKPKLPDQEIFNAFKKRLLATHVRLVCMNCGNYNIVKEVEQVDQQPECPKCNSRLLAVAHKNQNLEVLKKKSKTEEEQKQWQMLIRSADLVITYGKRAVICLAARGVGPENASRILARLHTTEEALFKDILEAEKQFAKTRIYWD